MTIGGKSAAEALAALRDMSGGVAAIGKDELQERVAKAQAFMRKQGIAALYVNAGTSLAYFTGTHWYPSERMVGAVIPAEGALEYIGPAFEEATINSFMGIGGRLHCWHEHENPYALFLRVLERLGVGRGARVALDESTPFFIVDGIRQLDSGHVFENAKPVTAHCRTRKSAAEIAIMQRAKDMTLRVQKAAASILREGISTTEVAEFINEAHRRVAGASSYFCIVLFGEPTAYPHGVAYPQTLQRGDMVLIDTGVKFKDYISDITRSYVFGEPTQRQRFVWNAEKTAQQAAFEAAQLGVPCREVDAAARRALEANGFGPGYDLPGLPHRTGHGIGMDIHEWPYLVGSDDTPLDVGMCFSNEPMICIPGEFGVRHEDHFYMTESGPKWFTQPAFSIDDPFRGV